MKILQINSTVNTGSTGRIAEEIGIEAMEAGYESFIAHGRGGNPSKSEIISIGNKISTYNHGIKTLLFDRHGFGSTNATKSFLKELDQIKPDIVALHNLHGYYINIMLLFQYLAQHKIPVVWTLFDCWAFTGHCTYYDDISCPKWKVQCHDCPKTHRYPKSVGMDQSKRNYKEKKQIFNSLENLHLIVHSKWLKSQVEQSFLNGIATHHIYNGVNLSVFRPDKSKKEKLILGVASTWDERKGLKDFISLRSLIPEDFKIVLIGLNKKQLEGLPDGILGITRTENVQELAQYYSKSLCFLNPTYQDNFPTTNIEALACGTPVITYNTGGSPEAIDKDTGIIVNKGDIHGLAKAIENVYENSLEGKPYTNLCRTRAEVFFNAKKQYKKYIDLFEEIYKINNA